MKVNEIFYSLQGEGAFTGTPAVFVRLSGCNLACPFCDTDFRHYKEMSEEEVAQEIDKYPAKHVVLTGGEPTLQITKNFLDKLISKGKEVQIETNGTHDIKDDRIWITCSPKFAFVPVKSFVKLHRIDELKVVYRGEKSLVQYEDFKASYYYLQPCDTGDKGKNKEIIRMSVEYCLQHPLWKLSLQTQKILNVR